MPNGKLLKAIALLLSLAAVFLSETLAVQKEEIIAKTIVDYLDSGRSVVAQNQALINDPSRGDKGFTPEVYETQVIEVFKKKTGKDIKTQDPADPVGMALIGVHKAAMEVISDAQPVINEQGIGFKGFVGAVFLFRTGERFYKSSGIRVKMIGVKARGDYHRADEFEEKILERFSSGWQQGAPYSETLTVGGRSVLRYLSPIYISKACLDCHGSPEGEIDHTGGVKEGLKIGDLKGATSILIIIR
jgi:hypothetical protein